MTLGLVAFRSLNFLSFMSVGPVRGWFWRCLFLNRVVCIVSNSGSAVPDGPSIDIWRSCRFLGAMLRALGGLPGGLGRFLPCRIGADHCRLRSIGWERCGHGLTSRPLEASDAGFLDDLLFLFGYPAGSGQSLVDGSLRMRYCSVFFFLQEAYLEVTSLWWCCGLG